MPTYQYKAYEKEGTHTRGVVFAESPEKAQSQLHEKGIFLTQLKEVSERGKKKKSKRHLLLFYKQLGIFIQGGKTLIQAFDLILMALPWSGFKPVISDLKERVHRGESLSQSLKAHPKFFSPFAIAMIKTGEESGNLTQSIEVLVDYEEKIEALRSQARNALAYPLFVVCFSIAVVLALFTLVIPTLESLYADLEGTLPLLTQIVLSISHGLKKYGVWVAMIMGGAFLIYRQTGLKEKIKGWFDDRIFSFPFFGKWIAMREASRFCLAMSTLVEGGLQLVRALELVEPIFKNRLYQMKIREVRDRVLKGESLGSALRRIEFFPSLASSLILTGEENGDLPSQMAYAGKYLEAETYASLRLFLTFLEPAMIILVGGLITIIVLAVILPIVQLNQLFS